MAPLVHAADAFVPGRRPVVEEFIDRWMFYHYNKTKNGERNNET